MTRTILAAIALLAIGFAIPSSAQPPVETKAKLHSGASAAKGDEPSLAMTPTDSFIVVSVKVSKLWDIPGAKPLRDWVDTQKDGIPLNSIIGVSVGEVDRITAFAPTLTGLISDIQPVFAIVTTRQPYNEAKVLKALGVDKMEGRENRRLNGRVIKIESEFSRLAFIDDRTFLLFSDTRNDEADWANLVVQLLSRKSDGPLAAALIAAKEHDVTIGIDIKAIATLFDPKLAFPEFPKELIPYQMLLKAKSATFTVDFGKDAKSSLIMSFPDATIAKRAGPVLDEGLKDLASALTDTLPKQSVKPNDKAREVVRPGLAELLTPWFITALKGAKVTVDGTNVVATSEAPYAEELVKVVAALPKSMSATRHTARAINNLKQLVLAGLNFESAYGFMPSDIFQFGDKAVPMSWRIQILPFIEQGNLYNSLDHKLSWDDPANLKILESAEMPKVFEIPGREAPKGHTYFRIFAMPKGAKGAERPLLKEGERGPKITEISDGTSNTFMIVEAGEAVPWYKPDLLAYDGKLPLPQLGDKKADRFLAGFCDGHVLSLRPSKLGEKNIRALITINGGEAVEIER